jgi:hypothetical protein
MTNEEKYNSREDLCCKQKSESRGFGFRKNSNDDVLSIEIIFKRSKRSNPEYLDGHL